MSSRLDVFVAMIKRRLTFNTVLAAVSFLSAIIGLAPILTGLLSLRLLLRRLRMQLLVAPDLAVLYFFLSAATVGFFFLAIRAHQMFRRGDATYALPRVLWSVLFCAASATTYFVPRLYQSGLQAWEVTSKRLEVRIDANGDTRAKYIFEATAQRDNLRYFVMDIPVLGDPSSDEGEIELLEIAGEKHVAIQLASFANRGNKRSFVVNSLYKGLFPLNVPHDAVSLKVDGLFEDIRLDVYFPKPPKSTVLYLYYLSSYEAIPGQFRSPDGRHFSFIKRDQPFSWLPHTGVYRLVWKW